MNNFDASPTGATIRSQLWANQARVLQAVFVTAHTRMDGHFRSLHRRFSDAMNAVDQGFLFVQDVETQPHGLTTESAHAAALFLGRDQIIFATAAEAAAGQERSSVQQDLTTPRIPQRVRINAWPFALKGNVHLSQGTNLLQHIHEPLRPFMPMTEVVITYLPNPELSFEAAFLVVNRHHVESLIDEADVGQEHSLNNALPTNVNMEDRPIDARRVAELLLATEVFRQVDVSSLEAVCSRLCAAGAIMRKIVEKDVVLFSEHDIGDTLYLIEKGRVVVSNLDSAGVKGQKISYLHAGELFGEMAVLGDHQRTATVRTVAEATFITLNEDATKALFAEFPSAAAALLKVMLRRSGR